MKSITGLVAIFLVSGCAQTTPEHLPIMVIASPSLDFKHAQPLLEISEQFEVPATKKSEIPFVPFRFKDLAVVNCGLMPDPINNHPKIAYTLIFQGKLSGHSAFSANAQYTESDYWQVIFNP